jgi:hypothetical protein
VGINGLNLRFLNLDHRNDKEIVLEAVKKFGPALEFASERIKND